MHNFHKYRIQLHYSAVAMRSSSMQNIYACPSFISMKVS